MCRMKLNSLTYHIVLLVSELSLAIQVSILVGLFVSRQVRALGKPLVASWIRADVWLLSGMSSQVGSEIEVKGKSFEAELALERFLPSMNELMSLEFGIVEESLSTAINRADVVPLSVCHLVFSER